MKEMPQKPQLEKGLYRHYKGGLYRFVDLACDTETLEWCVVYESLKRKEENLPSVWVRPYKMFTEKVMVNGEEVSRFQKVSDE